MAELVDLLIEDQRWQALGLEQLALTACSATLVHLGLDVADFEISLLGCDDARIMILNQDFRDKPTATNVLSWPAQECAAAVPGGRPESPQPQMPGMTCELGDIAIAYETCAREAAQAGHQMAAHVSHLLAHGTLHLLGYDHISAEDAGLMEGLEAEILASLGLADPYRDH